jgi:hypothetical protein
MAQIDAPIAHLEAQEELSYIEAGILFGVHFMMLIYQYI